MNEVLVNVKGVALSAILATIAYLNPIQMDVLVIAIMTLGNFFAGWWENKYVHKEGFSLKKFRAAMTEALVYVILIIGVFIVLSVKGIADKALYCTSVISYAVIYFLGLNIIRNLKSIFPNSRVLAFLYFAGSLEFTKNIPMLKTFLENENKPQRTESN